MNIEDKSNCHESHFNQSTLDQNDSLVSNNNKKQKLETCSSNNVFLTSDHDSLGKTSTNNNVATLPKNANMSFKNNIG